MQDSRQKRTLLIGSISLGLLIAAVLLLSFRPPCLILRTTGFYCPGCGTSRMLDALTHLDINAAFSANPLMFFLLPIGFLLYFYESIRFIKTGKALSRRWEQRILIVLLVILILFSILRNLPVFWFLRPNI